MGGGVWGFGGVGWGLRFGGAGLWGGGNEREVMRARITSTVIPKSI